MPELTGPQRQQVYEALLDAFPIVDELARMVAFGLDISLQEITTKPSLSAQVFDVIEWTDARGRSMELIRRAIEANPGNPRLQAMARQMGTIHGAVRLPSRFTHLVGREDDLQNLRTCLTSTPTPAMTVIHGWPGVGKSAFAIEVAYDPVLRKSFPDGVLWAALGERPNILGELTSWAVALGSPAGFQIRSMEDATALLKALLRERQCLLIVDDAWEAADIAHFRVGGPGCALVVTTRLFGVARAIAPNPAADLYKLNVLSDDAAVTLLKELAPTVVATHPEPSMELVRELEGLPLSIHVAGRLLHTEASFAFEVTDLLAEIKDSARLLQENAPQDRDEDGIPLTVTALLRRSTDRLTPEMLEYFAYLGAFAPKPATFDLGAMQAVWEVPDAKPIVRNFIDRGLLEPTGAGRYWMHALLVDHAKSFLT